jgi:hypothetical protein
LAQSNPKGTEEINAEVLAFFKQSKEARLYTYPAFALIAKAGSPNPTYCPESGPIPQAYLKICD